MRRRVTDAETLSWIRLRRAADSTAVMTAEMERYRDTGHAIGHQRWNGLWHRTDTEAPHAR